MCKESEWSLYCSKNIFSLELIAAVTAAFLLVDKVLPPYLHSNTAIYQYYLLVFHVVSKCVFFVCYSNKFEIVYVLYINIIYILIMSKWRRLSIIQMMANKWQSWTIKIFSNLKTCFSFVCCPYSYCCCLSIASSFLPRVKTTCNFI